MFAENLKRLRKRKRLSQEELARHLGITRQGYSKYENDSSEPSFDMLIKLADLFDVTTDELLGRTPKPVAQVEPEPQSLFPFDQVGISQGDFENLSAYQQEVLEWAVNAEGLFFKDKSDNVLDMMERLEIAYEVDKVMKKRKQG